MLERREGVLCLNAGMEIDAAVLAGARIPVRANEVGRAVTSCGVGFVAGMGFVDRVIAVGPVPMMKAVANVTREKKIKTIASLNAMMLDATGMCGVCRVVVGGKIKFSCVDGPEFDAHEINFEELSTRLNAYKDEEKLALAKCEKCK